jgi:hypothetical protein
VANLDMTFGLAQSPIIKIALTKQGPSFMRTRSLMPTNKAALKEVAVDIHVARSKSLQLVVRLSGLPNRNLGRREVLS